MDSYWNTNTMVLSLFTACIWEYYFATKHVVFLDFPCATKFSLEYPFTFDYFFDTGGQNTTCDTWLSKWRSYLPASASIHFSLPSPVWLLHQLEWRPTCVVHIILIQKLVMIYILICEVRKQEFVEEKRKILGAWYKEKEIINCSPYGLSHWGKVEGLVCQYWSESRPRKVFPRIFLLLLLGVLCFLARYDLLPTYCCS